jgi:uncharacterized protein DUF5995
MVVAVAGALALSAAPASAAEPVYVPWTTLLPAMPGDAGTTGGPQPGCRKASMRCVNHTIRRMRRTQNRFGCDHRAVFATTYLMLTRVMKRTMKADPRFFRDRAGIIYQIALFSRIYFRTLKAYERGDQVDPAWQTALDNATKTDLQGSGDMLLGINAHVQNDMPFVIAALGVREPDGTSRKPDHDAMNEALNRGYEAVVEAVRQRYDPTMSVTNTRLVTLDNIGGLELARIWREGVWRNAERLLEARTDAERALVAQQIETNAALWAQGIAAIQTPGIRAMRDHYCADRLAPSG